MNRTLHDVSDTELPADLAHVAFGAGLVLLHTGVANHLQIRDLREVGQDLVLNAIGKVGVVLVFAQAGERQDGDGFLIARPRCSVSSRVATEEEQPCRDRGANNDDVNPSPIGQPRRSRHGVGFCRAFDAFGSDLKRPGENERKGKANDNQQNHQPDDPGRNVEDREDLRDSLSQGPAGDDVSDSNFVNVAPFQFGKEVVDLHFEVARNCAAGTTFSANASKRGSPRSGVSSGSTRIGPMLKPSRS